MTTNKIPLLDLKAQHAPIRAEILSAIEKVVDSQAFIMGPEVKLLEERVAAYSRTKHGIGVSSGTDALLIALMALNIGPGDEVIVPDYSFFATAGAVSRLGAKPVFVDIDPVTFNIDPNLIERGITSRTKAIIPVHLFGQCADMEPILAFAKNHNLRVIEDAAQAIGAEYKDGKRAGTMGDIGCFSFFPSKNLGGFGDGGMVVTNTDDLTERLGVLRIQGAQTKYHHRVIGGNFRLDTIQAAILNVKLDFLDEWTKCRQENAQEYRRLFGKAGLVGHLLRLPDAIYAAAPICHPHIYNQFVLRVMQRDDLRKYLQREGIGCEVYYPVPFHLQECFQNLGYHRSDFPESIRAADETLAIPIYPKMRRDQLQTVVEKIKEFYS